jgi:hypothetical protein
VRQRGDRGCQVVPINQRRNGSPSAAGAIWRPTSPPQSADDLRAFRQQVGALESTLSKLRTEELTLDVNHLDPLDGLLKLFDFMNGHFERHGDLVSLLRTENGTKARYMKKSSRIHEMSSPVLAMTERLLSRGVAEAKLAADIDPLPLYVMIAALSQFHLTNAHTWRAKRHADARRMLAAYLVNQTAG